MREVLPKNVGRFAGTRERIEIVRCKGRDIGMAGMNTPGWRPKLSRGTCWRFLLPRRTLIGDLSSLLSAIYLKTRFVSNGAALRYSGRARLVQPLGLNGYLQDLRIRVKPSRGGPPWRLVSAR